MKHPNGYGSVIKLSGKRRKPFAARITDGWELNTNTGKVKQKYKYVGYYKTRQEAMIALAEYNKDPYDIDNKKATFADIYSMWAKEKFKDKPITRGYKAAFNLSEPLHNMKFIDIRKAHMQSIIDDMDKSYSTKSITKTLYGQLFKFALENDITDKNYAQFVTVPKDTGESNREPFSDAEIQTLWDSSRENQSAHMALIMIYTGLRPSELLQIENENINIDERYLIAGIKTDAGKDRIIPINEKILPLIRDRMSDQKYLFVSARGDKMSYDTFRAKRWNPLMQELNMKHKPHDGRHTFATLMDNAGANKVSIQKIMGHASQGITDKVYTHKNIDELRKAVDLM